MINAYNKFHMIIRINSLSNNYCWQLRAPRRPPKTLPELRQSNTYSKYYFRDKNKYRTKTIIFLEVYRLQLGQIHDQHLHQLSNRYMYKFHSIYLFVNSYLRRVGATRRDKLRPVDRLGSKTNKQPRLTYHTDRPTRPNGHDQLDRPVD